MKVGDLVRILRSDIPGSRTAWSRTIGMIVRANIAPDVSLRGKVHTVEMYGPGWMWNKSAHPRFAFIEGDMELISENR